MTSASPERRQTASIPEQLADWFQVNTRYVAIGAGVVVAAGLGLWFYTENAQRTARVAEQQLMNARRSMATGNIPLAQTDLKRIVDNHANTRAGVEAALLLSETYFQDRKFAEGIDVLDDFTASGKAEYVRSKIYSLIGDGQMELGQTAEAAGSYRKAAEAARFEGDKAQQRAKQARALTAAGDTAAARSLWADLVKDPSPGVAAEARVRVGELAAKPAARS